MCRPLRLACPNNKPGLEIPRKQRRRCIFTIARSPELPAPPGEGRSFARRCRELLSIEAGVVFGALDEFEKVDRAEVV